ncbi:MAG: bacterial transcriptional activator domain-containing protein [Actinobacteria bacterium]|nr:bacterial transcriptional activator domain-containing protein [Actinomycetota bacterium]
MKLARGEMEGTFVERLDGLSGDLLPDWYEDWVELERERLRQLRMHALENLALEMCLALRYGEALEAGYASLRCEPLRESAHRVLIQIHLAEGNMVEARRQYDSYRTMLDSELGLTPSAQMEGLIAPARMEPAWLDEGVTNG